MGSPIIWSGNSAKLLKPILDFFGQAQILSGTVDPSSVATSAPKGSLYLNTSNGNTYKKTDAGLTTNWTIMTNTASWSVDTFSGTGAQTAFTLSSDPGSVNNMFISINGVLQLRATYSVSGTTLTFTEAPPTGTNNIDVAYGASVTIGTPSAGSVTAASMGTASVGTAALIAGSVTPDKLSALNYGLSSTISFSTASATYVDVTGSSVTVTTNGRPVFVCLVPDSSSFGAVGARDIQGLPVVTTVNAGFKCLRGATNVGEVQVFYTATGSATTEKYLYVPPSSIGFFDPVAAGTYTYKLQAIASNGTAVVQTCKLFVREL